ncbi:MAG: polysaccharide biosynthesis/export family protein [Desulfobulbus sp.]
MHTVSMAVRAIVLVVFWCCLWIAHPAWAAESSDDVAVSPAQKEQHRKAILGAKGLKPTDEEYVIGYRDVLYVEIYGEGPMAVGPDNPATPPMMGETMADLSAPPSSGKGTRGADVGMDGRISLRHIGDVYVVGMTLTQLADYLKKLYSEVFDGPNVITSLVQSNSRQYTVMGQIRTPGLYPLDSPTLLVSAIAKAGGFTEWANSKVTIIRTGNGHSTAPAKPVAPGKNTAATSPKAQQFTFNYDDFLKGKDPQKNIEIEPGDTIVAH